MCNRFTPGVRAALATTFYNSSLIWETLLGMAPLGIGLYTSVMEGVKTLYVQNRSFLNVDFTMKWMLLSFGSGPICESQRQFYGPYISYIVIHYTALISYNIERQTHNKT